MKAVKSNKNLLNEPLSDDINSTRSYTKQNIKQGSSQQMLNCHDTFSNLDLRSRGLADRSASMNETYTRKGASRIW